MKFSVPAEQQNQAGIYIIANSIDARVYVGQTVNFLTRYRNHKTSLATGDHDNVMLQTFVCEASLEHLEFRVLEVCERGDRTEWQLKMELTEREAYYLGLYKAPFHGYGFNIMTGLVRLREFGDEYVLNSAHIPHLYSRVPYYIANRSYHKHVSKLERKLREYEEQINDIISSNLVLSETLEELEEQVHQYKRQCHLKEEERGFWTQRYELLLYNQRAKKKKPQPVSTPPAQLCLFCPNATADSSDRR